MDYASESARHRAEHLSRAAAAAARASYYAHPALHLHTYLPARSKDAPLPSERAGEVMGALNEAYVPPTSDAQLGITDPPSTAPQAQPRDEVGTSGTREEEGGKENAGKPSGMDRGALESNGEAAGTVTSPGPSATVVERAKQAGHAATEQLHHGVSQRMNPHLQLMCGPLLAYYTVKNGVWQGAALVVAHDSGSNYSSPPTLQLTFHPYSPPSDTDPTLHSPQEVMPPQTVQAQRIYVYRGPGEQGSNSFFRFMLGIPLRDVQMTVRYRLNGGAEMDFVVPAIGQNLRWAAHSCNGFSSGVNPDEFKGDHQSGYDPVWEDLLLRHHQKPFHCMVGGGDQIYCDPITREPELQSWINAPDRAAKLGHPLTDEMKAAVDRFYFNHYCKIFRSNAFSRANSSIPMVNMLDDHDLIDGFGTYDDETQAAPVMSYIGSRGYFWFLLFQLFTNDEVDGTNPIPGTHPIRSMIVGDARGPWIPHPSHSLLVYLGPKVSLLAVDARAERKLHEIVRPATYAKLFGEVRKVKGIEQLVILLGVPIAYPRMSFLEHFLDLKYNPINVLARHNAFGLGGMVNKFNQASELLDDLNDHWCANVHKKERNWLVLECQKLALDLHARITFLSGDVHLAAVGCLFSKKKKLGMAMPPEEDWRYMLNVVTSAIVNTPPPAGAARMVAILGGNKHRTLHRTETDEMMIPLFDKDTDGTPLKRKLALNRRNYTAVEYLESGELVFDIRVEKSQGAGETVGYSIRAPAPKWKDQPREVRDVGKGVQKVSLAAGPHTLSNGNGNLNGNGNAYHQQNGNGGPAGGTNGHVIHGDTHIQEKLKHVQDAPVAYGGAAPDPYPQIDGGRAGNKSTAVH